MSDDIHHYDVEDDDTAHDTTTETRLNAIGALSHVIRQTHWFTRIGQPLSAEETHLIQHCASATGFEAYPADIRDWEEASEAAASGDINSPWWEAEESLRAAVTQDALDHFDPDDLTVALTHVQAIASDVIADRLWHVATMWGMTEEDVIDAATGQAIQACHNAALLIASGTIDAEAESHPFSLKFKLFERGRWPIGVYGTSFMIF